MMTRRKPCNSALKKSARPSSNERSTARKPIYDFGPCMSLSKQEDDSGSESILRMSTMGRTSRQFGALDNAERKA